MRRSILFFSIAVVSQLLACGGGQAVKQPSEIQVSGSPVYVQSNIPFDKNLHVRDAVRNECALGTKFSHFIQSYGRANGTNVLPTSNLNGKKGRRLEVRIIRMNDAGGGAWSGAKSVAAEGKLIENGKVIGSFRGSRYSGGGAFGGFKGTCSILGRCVKALGRDISVWLQAPSMNAVLGDGV
jgi:hypothetical protein